MSAIKAVVRNGRIDLPAPAGLPDGTELLVQMTPLPPGKVGLDESEWRDDPAALADWDAWVRDFEPVELTAGEEADLARFRAEMRRFNTEAVRRQMAQGEP